MNELPDLSAPSPADGPTTPGQPAVPRPDAPSERPTERLHPAPPVNPAPSPGPTHGARRRGGWVGVVLGAVVLVILLVVVLQNLAPVPIAFLGLRATLPLGVWLLVAAAVGALLLAVTAAGRRRSSRRSRR